MREQSHKREMAAALRGDFERLRGRGVETTLGAPSGETAAAVEPPAEVAAEAAVEEAARRTSLLGRLLGRL